MAYYTDAELNAAVHKEVFGFVVKFLHDGDFLNEYRPGATPIYLAGLDTWYGCVDYVKDESHNLRDHLAVEQLGMVQVFDPTREHHVRWIWILTDGKNQYIAEERTAERALALAALRYVRNEGISLTPPV